MHKKIMIIGSRGAGKSKLAKEMGKKLNMTVYHLDALLWESDWYQVPREKQIMIQQDLVQEEQWI